MAQANKSYNTFVRGIITEASPLTFPENASIDEENFILNRDGSRQRRLGLTGFFKDSAYHPSEEDVLDKVVGNIEDNAFQVYKWEYNGEAGAQVFIVCQIATKILILSISSSDYIPYGILKYSFNIDEYLTGFNSSPHTFNLNFSYGKGRLFVAGRHITPFYVSYDGVNFSHKRIDIKIRDFEGLDDGLKIDENPTKLSNKHKYNLFNQGWTQENIDKYFNEKNVYPSNAQIWFVGKDAEDNFSPDLLSKTDFGNTPSPRGRYIVDAFNIDRGAISNIQDIEKQSDPSRPSAVSFYAGRVFYAGLLSTNPLFNNSNKIYFSKILETEGDEGKCYQEADPVSENYSDLIDTDGGVIVIPEASVIKKLVPVQGSLLVFASNGVWEINGAGSTFTATNYAVRKVNDIGAISSDSIVIVEQNIMYWANSGIYVLVRDASSVDGTFLSQNVSINTIQTLYEEIPYTIKKKVKLIYDDISKTVRAAYNDVENDDEGNLITYFKELIFDVSLQAFYKYKAIRDKNNLRFDINHYIGSFIIPSTITKVECENVVTNLYDDVVTNLGNNVCINEMKEIESISFDIKTANYLYGNILPGYDKDKYIIHVFISKAKISYSEYPVTKILFNSYIDLTYTDFRKEFDTYSSIEGGNYSNGISFESYLITGYELAEDTMRDKQVNYLICHFDMSLLNDISLYLYNTYGYSFNKAKEDLIYYYKNYPDDPIFPGCLVETKWDFVSYDLDYNDSRFSGKPFEAFRYPNITEILSNKVVSTKSKLRGHGKSISIKFSSKYNEELLIGYSLHLLGWAISMEGRSVV